ncbi:hypothetical protein [Saccharicrinis aurantiacus]|uniref:hypothetical protein n=1 Tax=Saccharicrinis aurantiacus TaxID=1849719 RepID=UPI0008399D9C|nr:hypothetical protein [Saccharicrinis aurantiacus]
MRSILRVALLAIVLTLGMSNVFAQELKPKMQAKLDGEVNEMVEVMGLDTDQKTKVYEIKKEQYIQRAAAYDELGKGTDEFKAKVKEVNKASMTKIKEVCSKEQMNKLYAHKKKK